MRLPFSLAPASRSSPSMSNNKTVSQSNRRSALNPIGEAPPTILALGADIKNRFLIARGNQLYFGPDIKDLSWAENFEFFKKEVNRAIKKFKPDIISCDLHPNYFSSILARELSVSSASNFLLSVQHHHAHIASVMQEHNLKTAVIGVSFDGTGYGRDGNSWGGEFLLVDKSGFRRLAHLKYRKMPGGDKVVTQPWRMVLSILGNKAFPFLKGVRRDEMELVLKMMSKDINSPLSSSAGRLFDAASALLGICVYASYEAQGPIELEAMCVEKIEQRYKFEIVEQNGAFIIDTDEIFQQMLGDLKKKKSKPVIATKFHNSMAELITAMVKRLSSSSGIRDIALSGGVFQNKFLKKKAVEKLAASGFRVFTNEKIPVNDLNISLGQYYVSCHTSKS